VQPAEELPVPHPVARIAYFGELGDQAVRVVALHARQPHVRVRHQRQRPAGAGEHLHLVQRLPASKVRTVTSGAPGARSTARSRPSSTK
jgi:hypothetical protein